MKRGRSRRRWAGVMSIASDSTLRFCAIIAHASALKCLQNNSAWAINALSYAIRAQCQASRHGQDPAPCSPTVSRPPGSRPSRPCCGSARPTPGLPVCLLAESQSRALNLDLAELAALRLGCRPFRLHRADPAADRPGPGPLDRRLARPARPSRRAGRAEGRAAHPRPHAGGPAARARTRRRSYRPAAGC